MAAHLHRFRGSTYGCALGAISSIGTSLILGPPRPSSQRLLRNKARYARQSTDILQAVDDDRRFDFWHRRRGRGRSVGAVLEDRKAKLQDVVLLTRQALDLNYLASRQAGL